MNKIIKYKWQKKDITLTFEDVKQLIATSTNVTDKEIILFMKLCEYRGLNPFLKEAYLIKYGNEPAKQVVSKDVFDQRADADPRYNGQVKTTNYKRGMNLNDFWINLKIYRKECQFPVSDVTVYYPEYVGKKKDGTINKMWGSKPYTMLNKVCVAQAKRESNPKDLAGMYQIEEFDQEIKPTEEEIKNINPIPQTNNNHQEVTTNEPLQNPDPATQPQKDKIYGEVVCEKCGTRVYGFRCPKCKNADNIHVTKKGFIHSHLLTKEDFKNNMKPILIPDKLTKIDAMIIWDWWLGDSKNMVVGERLLRESKEKEAKPKQTKEEKIKQARDIVRAGKGKLEVKNKDNYVAPDEKQEPQAEDFIAPEDIPG